MKNRLQNMSAMTKGFAQTVSRALALCVSVLAVTVSNAAELINGSENQSSTLSGTSMNTDYFLQVILALILVIGVIVVLSVLAKRFSVFPGTGSGPIKVLSGVSLGGKDRLILVQVGDEQLLVGTSPGNVQKVHKLQQPIDLKEFQAARSTDKPSFASILNAVTRN